MAGRVSISELAARLTCDDQVLCIVNNRGHARALLQALRDSGQMAARLLTTAITAADRAGKLDSIKLDLLNRRPVHVVATSLIEAGVDVDFPVVWRAMAGIDSIAQAAGRCNREGLLGSNGRVFVFEPDEDSGRPPPELRQFAEAARVVLSKHDDALSLEAVHD